MLGKNRNTKNLRLLLESQAADSAGQNPSLLTPTVTTTPLNPVVSDFDGDLKVESLSKHSQMDVRMKENASIDSVSCPEPIAFATTRRLNRNLTPVTNLYTPLVTETPTEPPALVPSYKLPTRHTHNIPRYNDTINPTLNVVTEKLSYTNLALESPLNLREPRVSSSLLNKSLTSSGISNLQSPLDISRVANISSTEESSTLPTTTKKVQSLSNDSLSYTMPSTLDHHPTELNSPFSEMFKRPTLVNRKISESSFDNSKLQNTLLLESNSNKIPYFLNPSPLNKPQPSYQSKFPRNSHTLSDLPDISSNNLSSLFSERSTDNELQQYRLSNLHSCELENNRTPLSKTWQTHDVNSCEKSRLLNSVVLSTAELLHQKFSDYHHHDHLSHISTSEQKQSPELASEESVESYESDLLAPSTSTQSLPVLDQSIFAHDSSAKNSPTNFHDGYQPSGQQTSQKVLYNYQKSSSEELQELNGVNAYPNGPRNVLNNLVFLYSDPGKDETDTSIYDLVINVAKDCVGAKHKNLISIPWKHTSVISKDLPFLVKKIDECYESGKKVLIHCQCGVSRSACVVIAYFMFKFDISVIQAYELLKEGTADNSKDAVIKSIQEKGYIVEACDRICPNMSLIFELMEFGDKLGSEKSATSK